MLKSKIVVNCQPSIAPFLHKEVEGRGYKILQSDKNGVTVEGGWKEVIDLNLNLRTASRVLWLIKSFEANHPDKLYEEAKKIPWHTIIPAKGYISIQSFVKNDYILDIRFANVRLKDAIVDRMQEENGERPDSGKERDRTVVYLYWYLNEVHVYIDTSGETIAKHGYRKIPFKAPMIEALASACLLSADWREDKGSFINPMCGSGTLAIEAAMMAAGIPPNLNRRNFGFMHLKDYDNQPYKEARNNVTFKDKITADIIATDWDGEAIEAARQNAKLAGVEHMITFDKVPFEKTFVPSGPGIVMLNPEYGERLGEEEELKTVYREIGDFFKQDCKGKMGYIFTGNAKLAKSIGLRTSSRTEFQNAKIDCRLLAYELYDGSKRPDEERPAPRDVAAKEESKRQAPIAQKRSEHTDEHSKREDKPKRERSNEDRPKDDKASDVMSRLRRK
ncbi:class I SAM-dependent RNA methyltransferase [Reichenbachiella agarivorans]|uniref:Class I SAM-dependent RNA methyltransferase n=1 Tax=Reichenbachiella agarivorans TaxID=2979464 RepID=A0ABY6CQM5_9BACT|nr:class I SAM-dependent RNA methyltransferase [Reichenbachiella agarivorans]UXP30600.1 class I SAM-dependent RNA methyltransferase [Reichenbachiella agarivorans]